MWIMILVTQTYDLKEVTFRALKYFSSCILFCRLLRSAFTGKYLADVLANQI